MLYFYISSVEVICRSSLRRLRESIPPKEVILFLAKRILKQYRCWQALIPVNWSIISLKCSGRNLANISSRLRRFQLSRERDYSKTSKKVRTEVEAFSEAHHQKESRHLQSSSLLKALLLPKMNRIHRDTSTHSVIQSSLEDTKMLMWITWSWERETSNDVKIYTKFDFLRDALACN